MLQKYDQMFGSSISSSGNFCTSLSVLTASAAADTNSSRFIAKMTCEQQDFVIPSNLSKYLIVSDTHLTVAEDLCGVLQSAAASPAGD
jgi:hypothetical protein